MKSTSNQGFTIIELLIVIMIVGILASILTPNLIQARTRAADTATQGFLRDVAVQQVGYFADNGSFSGTTASLPDLPATVSQLTILSESASANDFCVAAQYNAPGTTPFHITSAGNILSGNCP